MLERKTNWPLSIFLLIISAPILVMYLWPLVPIFSLS